MENFRQCSKCGRTLLEDEFYPRPNRPGKFLSWCKDCLYQSSKKYKQNNKIKLREKRYLKKYGITLEEYNIRFKEQNGVCAICGNPEFCQNQHGLLPLAIDHNHKTGKIRGLLCSKCNPAIGSFEVDKGIELLCSAISYLKNTDGEAD